MTALGGLLLTGGSSTRLGVDKAIGTQMAIEDGKYTGDILFIGGTPIVWAGPLSNWIAACDLMLGLDADTVVPGHGPLTDAAGIVKPRLSGEIRVKTDPTI